MSFPGTARGDRNARTWAGARCSNTRYTAPTSSRGSSARRNACYARVRNVFGYDVEDTAVCTIEHESGVVGTLLSIFNGVRGREERRLEVFFERGAVEVTTDFLVGAREDGFLVQRPDEEPDRLDVEALRNRHFEAEGIDRRDFFVYLYPAARAFVRSVRDQQAASPTFADARAAHALVDAAYRSVSENAAANVDLEPKGAVRP